MIKKFQYFLPFIILFLVYIFLYKIYSPKVNAFGCFDECSSYIAGYFMLKGKTLYSEIFLNHQRLMADISYLIQKIFHPINIYELVLRHRQFVLLFGFLFNLMIVLRFRFVGLGFLLFYEFSKFYLFGDRFLGEGLIVYPLVYITGLIWYKFQNKKVYPFEYILGGIFTWFIIFVREPFVPLTIFVYFLILWGREGYKPKIFSLGLFTALTLIMLIITPLKDYIMDVFIVNKSTIFASELKTNKLLGIGIFKIFFYPLYIFWDGKWNLFRFFLLGLSITFLASIFLLIKSKANKKLLIIIFLILGLANLRPVDPGTIFYGAFHMLPWYGLFTFITFLMLNKIYRQNRKYGILLTLPLFFSFCYFLFSPKSFIYDKTNQHEEFITNYGRYLEAGEVIKALSNREDTLFLEGYDYIIYWQSNLLSSYKYSLYVPVMVGSQKFSQSRLDMFANNPPDFYYGHKEISLSGLPSKVRKDYMQLYSGGKPSHLYVGISKLSQISKYQWEEAKKWSYGLKEK